MKRPLQLPIWTFPIALLVVAVASYGLLIRWLGFYWDDWAFAWISHTFGPAGLVRYFSTNRPVWGLIYELSMPILGPNPLAWQVFGIGWRWLSAVAMWWAFSTLWPARRVQLAWIALLFLVYPGFGQQSIAITFGHFFFVLTIYFLSLGAMLWSIRRPAWRIPLTAAALLGAAFNLFAMEYFFGLELLRGVFIWVALGETILPNRQRLIATLRIGRPTWFWQGSTSSGGYSS